MSNSQKDWFKSFLTSTEKENIDQAIKQQLYGDYNKPWESILEIDKFAEEVIRQENEFVIQRMLAVNVDPDIVIKQKKYIAELSESLEKLTIQIERGEYIKRPCPLGTIVYCVLNDTIVKGYIHSYEDMYNAHTKEVVKIIKIALIGIDGIIHKSISEFGKTIFLNEVEAKVKN